MGLSVAALPQVNGPSIQCAAQDREPGDGPDVNPVEISHTEQSLRAQFMKQARRFVTRAQIHSADLVVTLASWVRLHRSTRAEKCISSRLWCEGRHSRFGMQPGVGQSDGGHHKQIRNIITPEKRRCCSRHNVGLRPANRTVYPGGRCECWKI